MCDNKKRSLESLKRNAFSSGLGKIGRKHISFDQGRHSSYLEKRNSIDLLEKLHIELVETQKILSESWESVKFIYSRIVPVDAFNELEKSALVSSPSQSTLFITIDDQLDWILSYILGTSPIIIRKGLAKATYNMGLTYLTLSRIILNNYKYEIPMSIFFGIDKSLDILLNGIYEAIINKKEIKDIFGRVIEVSEGTLGEQFTEAFFTYIYRVANLCIKNVAEDMESYDEFLKCKDITPHSIGISNIIYRNRSSQVVKGTNDVRYIIGEFEYELDVKCEYIFDGNFRNTRFVKGE